MDLDRTAGRFDALYSELTLLQRRLIAARRNAADETSVRDLIEEADVITAAVSAARRALILGERHAPDVEAAALASRVLRVPIDDYLLIAAIKAQGRTQAYPLLSAALRMSASDMPAGLGSRSLQELLASPRSVGSNTARALIRHWELDPSTLVRDVSPEALDVLCAQIEDAASELPASIRRSRGQKTAAPADGMGAGRRILEAWVDSTGTPDEGIRPIAAEVAQRQGWSSDAVPVALRLAEITIRHVAPAVIPGWDQIAMITNSQEQILAARAQSKAWWRTDDEDLQVAAFLLRQMDELLTARRHLASLVDDYSQRIGGDTAVGHSRRIAKRCGLLLSCSSPEAAREVLSRLPG